MVQPVVQPFVPRPAIAQAIAPAAVTPGSTTSEAGGPAPEVTAVAPKVAEAAPIAPVLARPITLGQAATSRTLASGHHQLFLIGALSLLLVALGLVAYSRRSHSANRVSLISQTMKNPVH